MTNDEIKEYLLKELKEANKCYEESAESEIERYWQGYIDALDVMINNLFGEEAER